MKIVKHGYVAQLSIRNHILLLKSVFSRQYFSKSINERTSQYISSYFDIDYIPYLVSSGSYALELAAHLVAPSNLVCFPEYCCVSIPMSLRRANVNYKYLRPHNKSPVLVDLRDLPSCTNNLAYLYIATFGDLSGLHQIIAHPSIDRIIIDISHGVDLSQFRRALLSTDKVKAVIFSAYATKFYGGIKGGVLLLRNHDYATKAIMPYIDYADHLLNNIYGNGNLSSIDALFLMNKFQTLSAKTLALKSLKNEYMQFFKSNTTLPPKTCVLPVASDNPYRFCLKVCDDSISSQMLACEQVQFRKPVEPWLEHHSKPANELFNTLISIPFHQGLDGRSIEYIMEALSRFQ